jgi:hypothetical protein
LVGVGCGGSHAMLRVWTVESWRCVGVED